MTSNPFIICIVDDDEVYQFSATRIINATKLAKKILVFNDGQQAIQFLIDNIAETINIPDVIFLDINMPIMDGWQFIEEYIVLRPRIGKIITLYMISLSVDSLDINRANRMSEISDYIVKPITQEMFKELILKLDQP